MNKLPSGWETVRIGSISVECEQVIPTENREFVYIDISSVDRDVKAITKPQILIGRDAPSRARKVVKTGDVILSLTRPSLNAVAIVGEELDNQIASTGFEVIRIPGIDSKWIFYFLQSEEFVNSMTELVQGSLYPAITSKDLRNYNIPFAPLEEQNRIISKLDLFQNKLTSLKDKLGKVPNLLEDFRQSILESVITGELTKDWRENRPELKEWEQNKLSKLIIKFGKGSTPKDGGNSYETTGIPFIRSMNVVFFGFKREGLIFLNQEQAEELASSETLERDILINITGSSIGRVTLTPTDLNGARINQNVFLIRPRPSLLPEFLCFILSSPSMQKKIGSEKYGSTTKQALTKQQISDFIIPVPTIEEQEEIVRRVEAMLSYATRLENGHEIVYAQVGRLMPALLRKAFNGELVKQNQNNESASKLLKQISYLKEEYNSKKVSKPKARGIKTILNTLEQVLSEESEWIQAEEAFRRCGIKDGTNLELIENLYAELRALAKAGRLQVKPVKNDSGHKQSESLKLIK